MYPALWAFYDEETTMGDLVSAPWVDSLAPTPDISTNDPLELGVLHPSPYEKYQVSSLETLPEPISDATTIKIGEGSWAIYEDLHVEQTLSIESEDGFCVPVVRVSLSDNRLLETEDIEQTRCRTERVLRLAVEIFETSAPDFLFVTPFGPLERNTLPDPDEHASFLLEDLHWLYIASADTAAHHDRERLLSAPVYESRALENGGILLRMYETMANDDVGPEPRDRLREHLMGE